MFDNQFSCELFHQSIDSIIGFACHPKMPWFAIGLVDPLNQFGRVEIWDLETKKVLRRKDLGNLSLPTQLSFTQDGIYLVFATGADVVYAWRLDDDHPIVLKIGEIDQLSVAENHLVAVSGKESVQLWNLDNGNRIWTSATAQFPSGIPLSEIQSIWPLDYLDTGGGMMVPISAKATLTPRGDKVLISGDLSETVSIVDTQTLTVVGSIEPGPLLTRYAEASNDFVLVVGDAPMGEFLWRISDGKRVIQQYFKDFVPGNSCYAFHSQMPILATGGKAGMVIIYHLEREEGLAIQVIGTSMDEHFHMDFTAEGEKLIVVSRGNAIFVADISPLISEL